MLTSLRTLHELDTLLTDESGSEPAHHVLVRMDARHGDSLAAHLGYELRRHHRMPGGKEACYYRYDLIPGLPNEGFYRFCCALTDEMDVRLRGLPGLFALDITSCTQSPQAEEITRLLAFMRDHQHSTLFLLILDRQAQDDDMLLRRLYSALPVVGYDLHQAV